MRIKTTATLKQLQRCGEINGMAFEDGNSTKHRDGTTSYTGRLRVNKSNTSYRSSNPITGRSCGYHKPCWHGYRDFYKALYLIDPNAIITSGWGFRVVYRGVEDFNEKYLDTQYITMGSQIYPYHYIDKCSHA